MRIFLAHMILPFSVNLQYSWSVYIELAGPLASLPCHVAMGETLQGLLTHYHTAVMSWQVSVPPSLTSLPSIPLPSPPLPPEAVLVQSGWWVEGLKEALISAVSPPQLLEVIEWCVNSRLLPLSSGECSRG